MRWMLTLFSLTLIYFSTFAAEPPALTFQTKPLGELFEDVRGGAKLVGGDMLVKMFDDFVKQKAGAEKLDGLDLKQPIGGYVFLTGKEAEGETPPFVAVVPVTDAEAALKLFSQADEKFEPVKNNKGLYSQKGSNGKTTFLRVQEKVLYMMSGSDDAGLLSPDKLVPLEKLVDPKETAWLTVKFNFARMPEEMRKQMAEGLEKALKELKNAPLPPEAEESAKKAAALMQKMGTRILNQLKEAKEATFRIQFDKKTGETSLEASLSGLPGSSLAKDIASRPVTKNRFAGMMGKDTVWGVLGGMPTLNKEFAEMFATSLEDVAKEKIDEIPPPMQPLVKELVAGYSRTLKGDGLDFALVFNGPNDAGSYTALLGLSYDNTATLEKELKALVKEMAPPDVAKLIQFDVAKVGTTNLHLITPPEGSIPPQAQLLFGEKAQLGIAFTPKSILVAFGDDPISTLKPLVKLEPKPARALEFNMNSGRLVNVIKKVDADQAQKIAEMIGNKDELYSAFFVDLEGGSELKFKIGMNIKLIGQAVLTGISGAAPPPPKK